MRVFGTRITEQREIVGEVGDVCDNVTQGVHYDSLVEPVLECL